jgi:protein-tyrosine phosphatase
MAEVLFICTGNLCRSPSAALLLRQQLRGVGRDDVRVLSAGTVGADVGPPRPLVQESRAFGIDLAAHVPRTVDPGMIQAADLVVGMTREHVRQTVLAVPPSLPRTFTLREIVRRGLHTGPRGAAEDLGAWLARLHDGRLRADHIGASPDYDIIDPLGGRRDDYRRMLTEVSVLTQTLRDLAWPSAKSAAAGYGGGADASDHCTTTGFGPPGEDRVENEGAAGGAASSPVLRAVAAFPG